MWEPDVQTVERLERSAEEVNGQRDRDRGRRELKNEQASRER